MERHNQRLRSPSGWRRIRRSAGDLSGPRQPSAARAGQAPDAGGFGGMISLDLNRDLEGTRRILERTQLFTLAESLGGVESLIEHPAIMTHASIPAEQRAALGITDTLIRLSVGIEDRRPDRRPGRTCRAGRRWRSGSAKATGRVRTSAASDLGGGGSRRSSASGWPPGRPRPLVGPVRATRSHRGHRRSSRASRSPRSSLKVVSALIDLRSWSGSTARLSWPSPAAPGAGHGRPSARPAGLRLGAGQVADGAKAGLFQRLGEAPARRRAGCHRPRRQEAACASAAPITEKPRGLSRSEAILARNLLAARPTETVMPTSRSISACSRASTRAGGPPCSRSEPDRSSQASSSDSGWTRGVSASSLAMIRALSARYLAKSGLMTTASGHSFAP
jgi:hypothetical protein